MKTRNMLILSSLAILLLVSRAEARKAILSPAKVAAIASPTDARDTRVLLFFELPPEVMRSEVQVDFATLHCKAQVMDAAMGEIDVFPMTAQWKDASTISWSDPWNHPGGDYQEDFLPGNYSLRSEAGQKEVAIDITKIVQGWQKGNLSNKGLMLKLSTDDLSTSSVRYSMDRDNVVLRIHYSFE